MRFWHEGFFQKRAFHFENCFWEAILNGVLKQLLIRENSGCTKPKNMRAI